MADKDILTLRLESIEKAQQRSRQALFLSLLASAVVILLCSNYISFQPEHELPPSPNTTAANADEKFAAQENYKLKLKQHYDSQIYIIPLLGVPMGVDTLSPFGPVSLLVFAFYMASCFRSSLSQLSSLETRLDAYPGAEEREKIAVVLNSEVVLNLPGPGLRTSASKSDRRPLAYWFLISFPLIGSLLALGTDIRVLAIRYGNYPHKTWADFVKWFLDNGLVFDFIGFFATVFVAIYCSASISSSKKSAEIIKRLMSPHPRRIPRT
jgi:hypothetical protein